MSLDPSVFCLTEKLITVNMSTTHRKRRPESIQVLANLALVCKYKYIDKLLINPSIKRVLPLSSQVTPTKTENNFKLIKRFFPCKLISSKVVMFHYRSIVRLQPTISNTSDTFSAIIKPQLKPQTVVLAEKSV